MIITLLTDFGIRDYFVGAMKGVILSTNPRAQIIDITHEIKPQDIMSGGFTLFSVYRNFPVKTIHVAVVDPGVGSTRRAILVETENYQYFIAPDNGLLSLIFNEERDFRVFELTNEKFFRHPVSQTFHGRDVFAPAAAWLSTGVKPEEFGREIKDFVRLNVSGAQKINEHEIEAIIVHVDHFGNLITNLKREDLTGNFILEVNEKLVEKHHKYYAEALESEVFTIWGSAGFLEIVAYKDSARKLLDAETGQKIVVRIT